MAVLTVIDKKASATNITGRRPGDCHGKGRRNGSINGVATLFQNVDTHIRCQARCAGDNPVLNAQRCSSTLGNQGDR